MESSSNLGNWILRRNEHKPELADDEKWGAAHDFDAIVFVEIFGYEMNPQLAEVGRYKIEVQNAPAIQKDWIALQTCKDSRKRGTGFERPPPVGVYFEDIDEREQSLVLHFWYNFVRPNRYMQGQAP
ncbi:hypothetical protein NLJ89_g8978 [Agrocybe chaxingu]|uniref:Uncharacterized protein n=1 Tax=Agrocybe chaxingu TaxID=84603 RepID=A0A9W8JU75_9AGAR|nr:hypothetical protein NLJ89_g8978 [Agrocybe chaxingu]